MISSTPLKQHILRAYILARVWGQASIAQVGDPGSTSEWLLQGRWWSSETDDNGGPPSPPSHQWDSQISVLRWLFLFQMLLQIKGLNMYRSVCAAQSAEWWIFSGHYINWWEWWWWWLMFHSKLFCLIILCSIMLWNCTYSYYIVFPLRPLRCNYF